MDSRAVERELRKIEKKENQMRKKATSKDTPLWKENLRDKIPDKIMVSLEKMFCKAFSLVFKKGNILIEKTYDKAAIEKEFKVKDYALDLKGGKREIKNIKRDVAKGNTLNIAFSTAEGIVLGAFGIGLPDIVIWVTVLLRGIYETVLKYGFDYESPAEKMFILMILETSMSTGTIWSELNSKVDDFIEQETLLKPTEEDIRTQIQSTSNAFAMDMLVAKFIQGLPIIGIVGGVMNPVYYHKVMAYVQLKYRKRYLLCKISL